MGFHTIVLRIPEHLSRRLRELVESGMGGYRSIHDLIAVAIENQLHLEIGSFPTDREAPQDETGVLSSRPQGHPASLLEATDAADAPLFVLTNRLSPIKVAARVLSNMAREDKWPSVSVFQRKAALAARVHGLWLRERDRLEERTGMARRWVAFPVGDDTESTLTRYISSFTLWPEGKHSGGPMAVLGIAGVREGRAILSQKGWDIATLPSPILGETSGDTLSEAEARLLRELLFSAPSELAEVRSFLEIVSASEGLQAAIDKKLLADHSRWSERRAAAQRSAMIGRLSELGVLTVEGRGPRARVMLLEAARELRAN